MSCNYNKFKSSGGGQEKPPLIPNVVPLQAPQIPAIAPTSIPVAPPTPTIGCTSAGTTVARLISNRVVNGAPGQLLQYELSMLDCQGVQTPITANIILFDINATLDAAQTGGFGLPYSVTIPNGPIAGQGILNGIRGSDLFGNISPSYFHYSTNTLINLPAQIRSIILSVDLSNEVNHTPGTVPGGPFPPLEIISTFLRFGNATPVEQRVTFVNP